MCVGGKRLKHRAKKAETADIVEGDVTGPVLQAGSICGSVHITRHR
jgi:hypothetical protein